MLQLNPIKQQKIGLQKPFIKRKEATLTDKVVLLTKIVYLASVFDFSHYNSYQNLQGAINSLQDKDLNFSTIEKISKMIKENGWNKMCSLNPINVQKLEQEIGNELENTKFGSLVHVQNVMLKSGKSYITNMYRKSIFKPKNMIERLQQVNTAEKLYNLGNDFKNEMEYEQDNNPEYLLKYLDGKSSSYLNQLEKMEEKEIIELLKKLIKNKFWYKSKHFETLDKCSEIKDLVSFVTDHK